MKREKSISRTEEKAEDLAKDGQRDKNQAQKWGTAIVGGATGYIGGLMAVATKTARNHGQNR